MRIENRPPTKCQCDVATYGEKRGKGSKLRLPQRRLPHSRDVCTAKFLALCQQESGNPRKPICYLHSDGSPTSENHPSRPHRRNIYARVVPPAAGRERKNSSKSVSGSSVRHFSSPAETARADAARAEPLSRCTSRGPGHKHRVSSGDGLESRVGAMVERSSCNWYVPAKWHSNSCPNGVRVEIGERPSTRRRRRKRNLSINGVRPYFSDSSCAET